MRALKSKRKELVENSPIFILSVSSLKAATSSTTIFPPGCSGAATIAQEEEEEEEVDEEQFGLTVCLQIDLLDLRAQVVEEEEEEHKEAVGGKEAILGINC